jgi:predicted DNA-binding protein
MLPHIHGGRLCSMGTISGVRWHTMKRTTVKLPEDLDARLRHEAAARGATISEVTREAIAAYLGDKGQGRKLLAARAGRSGSSRISERIEQILAEELGSSPP